MVFLIMLLGFTVLEGMAEEKRPLVFKVDVKDEIGPEIWRLVKKSFEKAEQEKADLYIDRYEYVWRNGGVCRFFTESDFKFLPTGLGIYQ